MGCDSFISISIRKLARVRRFVEIHSVLRQQTSSDGIDVVPGFLISAFRCPERISIAFEARSGNKSNSISISQFPLLRGEAQTDLNHCLALRF